MGKLHDLAEIEEKNIQKKKKNVKFNIPTKKLQKYPRSVSIIKRFGLTEGSERNFRKQSEESSKIRVSKKLITCLQQK